MKAAIVIDRWKLSTFEKVLTEAGYVFVKVPGVTEDTLILTVFFKAEALSTLKGVVKRANDTAAKNKTN